MLGQVKVNEERLVMLLESMKDMLSCIDMTHNLAEMQETKKAVKAILESVEETSNFVLATRYKGTLCEFL